MPRCVPRVPKMTGYPGDRKAARQLAGLCGGLPLALAIIAALLNVDPTLSARELAEELAAETKRLEQLRYDDGSGPSSPSAAILVDLPADERRRVLADLARAHDRSRPRAAGRWQMHDLLRLYARQLSAENAEADRRDHGIDRLFGYYLIKAYAADQRLRAQPSTAVPEEFADRGSALMWLDAERPSL